MASLQPALIKKYSHYENFFLNGYCGKKSSFSMDLRPFKVVEVAQSTRIKELPLICLL